MTKNQTSLKRKINETNFVIVYFYTNWSEPCQRLNQTWEKITKNNSSTTLFLTVNIEIYPEFAQEFGIKRIPTILYIKNGRVLEKQIKFHTEMVIELTIEKLMDSY